MMSSNPGEKPKSHCSTQLQNPGLSRWRRQSGAGRGILRSSAFAIAAAGLLCLAGCGGKSSNSTNIKSVSITPSSVTVQINGQAEFTATITLSNSTISTTTSISWQVNGIDGGNATVGTITPSSVDSQVGIYIAPSVVPNPSNVSITAVVQQTNSSSTSSTPPTVTSNTATVTVGAGLGLSVTPTSAIVPAGGSRQFTALLNGLPDPAASWTVTSASGITNSSVIGSIGLNGLYTAPASPPPGGSLTITATDPTSTSTASASVTVVYSDLSLNGPYAFSYTGNDQSGFLAAAGSFVADGKGHITNGVEDVDSFLNGVSQGAAISGTYTVGSNGIGKATIMRGQFTEVWKFALITGRHAQLTLFQPNATGGGTIDQQSVAALSNSPSVISGAYVFKALGADVNHAPLGLAGEFSADGSGNVPASGGTLIDVNDNGTISSADATLNGTFTFDAQNPGSGRGTITLQSNSTGGNPREYAFYAVTTAVDPSNNTSYVTQMHLIEIDNAGYVAGDVFRAPSATDLGNGYLSPGNYAFTYGGSSLNGAYAAGGILTSDGNGAVTGGVLDISDAGTTTLNSTINSCTSSLDPTKRRIDLVCSAGGNTSEFAVYQTSLGSAVMLEIDPAAVATGTAYQQCGPASAGCAAAAPSISSSSLALGLVGQGVFYNTPASYQQDIDGQISLDSNSVTPGSIDINNFSAVFENDPISAVSLGTASSLGRGTTVVTGSNPSATYNLIYYLIDDQTALVLDQDQTYVLRGSFAQQY